MAKELIKIAKLVMSSSTIVSDEDLRKMIADCYDAPNVFTLSFNVLDGKISNDNFISLGKKFHDIASNDINLKNERHHSSVEKIALYLSDSSISKCRKYLEEMLESHETGTFGDVSEMKDPNGGSVIFKFHTGMGSEYVMSENGMSRRIKSNQGLGDEGIHDWHEYIFFTKMSPDDVLNSMWYAMYTKKNQTSWKTKIALDGDELCILFKRVKEVGSHKIMDKFEKASGYFDIGSPKDDAVIKVSRTPSKGMTVIEISNHSIHVGHRISSIVWNK